MEKKRGRNRTALEGPYVNVTCTQVRYKGKGKRSNEGLEEGIRDLQVYFGTEEIKMAHHDNIIPWIRLYFLPILLPLPLHHKYYSTKKNHN